MQREVRQDMDSALAIRNRLGLVAEVLSEMIGSGSFTGTEEEAQVIVGVEEVIRDCREDAQALYDELLDQPERQETPKEKAA
jgi:hypothetical protein